jgi:hypothetical protein
LMQFFVTPDQLSNLIEGRLPILGDDVSAVSPEQLIAPTMCKCRNLS